MQRHVFSKADLRVLEEAVEQILLAEGLPHGSISEFATGKAFCNVHAESIRLDLHLLEKFTVQVTHCGCDRFPTPVAAPPSSLDEMARDLAENIVRYWRSRERLLVRMAELAAAGEIEAAKGRAEGLDWRFVAAEPAGFSTYNGGGQSVVVSFDLLGHHLLPERYGHSYSSVEDLTRFFRSARPGQRALAARRDELAAIGAKGSIDSAAVAVILRSGRDPLKAVANVVQNPGVYRVDCDGTELHLYWRERTIRAGIDLAPDVRWEFGKVRLARDVWTDMYCHDRRIEEIVPSPLLVGQGRVKRTERDRGEIVLVVDPVCRTFDINDGVATWVGTETYQS